MRPDPPFRAPALPGATRFGGGSEGAPPSEFLRGGSEGGRSPPPSDLMAWFWRRKEAGDGRPKKVVIAEGLWIKCDSCKEIVYRAEVDRAGRVCPQLRLPVPHLRARPDQPPRWTRARSRSARPALTSRDPLEFKDTKKLHRSAEDRPQGQTGLEEAVITGIARIGGMPGRPRRVRVRVHGRQHGLGGGREAHAGDRARARQARAAPDRVRLGRRAHAGGHPLAHADGQDLRGARAPRPGAAALHLAAHRSRPPAA